VIALWALFSRPKTPWNSSVYGCHKTLRRAHRTEIWCSELWSGVYSWKWSCVF